METPQRKHINRKKKIICSPYFSKQESLLMTTDNDDGKIANVSYTPGLHETIKYTPPKSPFNLIQESLYDQPWKLLLATIFLQKTNNKIAIPLFWKFVEKYKTPDMVLLEEEQFIASELQPMGLSNKRATLIKRFSYEYLNKNWKYPIELYGIGKYGNDSYRIFCLGQWKHVKPNDTKLNLYHEWLAKFYESEN